MSRLNGQKNKAPAFQFYANDWLSSTRISLMNAAQEGGYIRLLSHAWSDADCSIPDDDDSLAILSRLGPEWQSLGPAVRACFIPHPRIKGRLVNERLLAERRKQTERRKALSASGKKGAEHRWGSHD